MSRAVRQDYIARIRYQNNLPPPPCPPKLLDIPIPISSYASSAFLSTLVQEQPLNIDIDTELGMPLDLTVIPGIFDNGDEERRFNNKHLQGRFSSLTYQNCIRIGIRLLCILRIVHYFEILLL